MENNFNLSYETLSSDAERISSSLSSMKLSKDEVNNATLLLEEVFVRFSDAGAKKISAKIYKLFGDVFISMSSSGEEFNPFETLSDWDLDSEDYLRDMIFRTYKDNLSYSRRGGKNNVTIKVHTGETRSMYVTFFCMLFGLLFGFVMKYFPQGLSSFISDKILSVVQTLFMNALSLLLAPVLFFSLASSFSSISNGREVGRISLKVVAIFIITTICSILVGFSFSSLFFSGKLPSIPESIMSVPEKMEENNLPSVISLLLGVIPRNLVSPILEGNMLQIIFVAVFSGITLCALGDRTRGIKKLFDEANDFFIKMIGMVVSFMPVIAFSSMSLLVFSSSMETLMIVARFLIVYFCASVFIFILGCMMILIVARISPLPYIRKAAPYLLTPFMISSSSACIPFTTNLCRKKLGVSDKISSFVVSLGATVNMNGTAVMLSLSTVLLSRMCGVYFDAATYVKLAFLILISSVGAAGVPNVGFVVLVVILSALGIPIEAAGLLLGVWNIIDRMGTSNNVNGDIASCLVVAKSEGEIDIGVYKG